MALALLSTLRREAVALRERVESYNQAHTPGEQQPRFRVVTYVGQNTLGHEEENGGD